MVGRSKRPIAGAARFVFVAALALLLPSLAVAGKFYPDDPLRKEPPPLQVEDASFRKLNDYVDLFENMFAKPGDRQPTEKEIRKGQKGGKDIRLIPNDTPRQDYHDLRQRRRRCAFLYAAGLRRIGRSARLPAVALLRQQPDRGNSGVSLGIVQRSGHGRVLRCGQGYFQAFGDQLPRPGRLGGDVAIVKLDKESAS